MHHTIAQALGNGRTLPALLLLACSSPEKQVSNHILAQVHPSTDAHCAHRRHSPPGALGGGLGGGVSVVGRRGGGQQAIARVERGPRQVDSGGWEGGNARSHLV